MNITVILIAFSFFIVVSIFLSRKYKNSTSENIGLLENESILFEDENVRVQQFGQVQDVIYNNCKVQGTNQRILISQKILFSKKYAMRYMIDYLASAEKTDLNKTLKTGYLIFSIDKTNITKELNKSGKNDILIKIPEYMFSNHSIQLRTNISEKYEEFLL